MTSGRAGERLPRHPEVAARPHRRTCQRHLAQGGGRRSADLLAAADYPIVAVCSNCGGAISLDRKLQMEWQHLPDGGGAR